MTLKTQIWQDSGWFLNGALADILVRFSIKTSQTRHFPGHWKVVSMVFIKSDKVYNLFVYYSYSLFCLTIYMYHVTTMVCVCVCGNPMNHSFIMYLSQLWLNNMIIKCIIRQDYFQVFAQNVYFLHRIPACRTKKHLMLIK